MPNNYRRIPPEIIQRIQTFGLDDIVAACAKRLRPQDFEKYAGLGLRIEDGELTIPPPFVPAAATGRVSKTNVEGKEIKRDDLPKISKSFAFYAPNWGSSANGEHLVVHTRQVYQRDFIAPKELELSITLLERQGDAYVLKFAIEQVINRRAPDFEDDLLYNLNLLQENVGTSDVFESDASLADYAATIRVDWELLPVGQVGSREIAQRILAKSRSNTVEKLETVAARLATFEKLRPTDFISGSSGFARYFGAKYADDFVVFENIRYGNALYVMFENWQELSHRSRIDLLKGNREGFERIEHRDGWEERLKAMLEHYRKRKRRGLI